MQETTWQSANFFVAHLLVSAEIYVALLLFVFGLKKTMLPNTNKLIPASFRSKANRI